MTRVALILALALAGLPLLRTCAGLAPPAAAAPDRDWEEAALLLNETWNYLDTYYVDALDAESRRRMAEGGAAGMVASLGDRYSRYVRPANTLISRQDTQGRFGGIGVVVSPNNGSLLISAVTAGGPADEAGIEVGDVITGAEGKEFRDLGYEEAVGVVRGEIGTTVTVTHLSWRTGESREVEMVRAVVEIPALGDVRMASATVGYVQVVDFLRTTRERLGEAVAGLMEEGAQALVLDLRGNPGGEMGASLEIVDMFLGEGTIVRLRFRSDTEEYSATPGHRFEELPLVVLVDGWSASASEIVAGAFQDHDRATIIGTRTFGKGLVQQAGDLAAGGSVVITAAVYETPDGRPVHGEGITPDIPFDPRETGDEEMERLLAEADELRSRLEGVQRALEARISDLGLEIAVREATALLENPS